MHFDGGKLGGLTEARQLNWVFMDIKKDIIEQKDHLWCIWDPLECQQKKIIKGKAFIITQPAWLKYVFHAFVCGALSSDNGMVCFRRKAFLKSDTAAGLTKS